jgi:probable phosphoglycerate mutase
MIGGNTDWPLTEIGKEQARNIGMKMKNLLENDIYTIFSSDLLRAKETAEIISKYLDYKIIYRSELREINVGSAKGKSKDWYRENCSPRENIPLIDYRAFPDAESYCDVYERIKLFIDEIIKNDAEKIIIVGHGLSLSMFILYWLKIPKEMVDKMSIEGNAGGVSFLSENDEKIRILNVWNDKSYMKNSPNVI